MCPQDHRALSEVVKLNPSMRVSIRHMMTTSTLDCPSAQAILLLSSRSQSSRRFGWRGIERVKRTTESGIVSRAEVVTREGRCPGRLILASGAPSNFVEEVLSGTAYRCGLNKPDIA